MLKVLLALREIVGELEGLAPQDVGVQTVAEVTDVGLQSGLVEQDVVQAINVSEGVGTSDGSDVMEVEHELQVNIN